MAHLVGHRADLDDERERAREVGEAKDPAQPRAVDDLPARRDVHAGSLPCYRFRPMAVVVAYLTCALVWGTTWYAIRACIGDGGYPTYEALAWRFVIATAVLIPLCVIAKIKDWPRGRSQWGWLVVAGL